MNLNKFSQKIPSFKTRISIDLSRYFLGLVFPLAVLLRIFNPQILESANFPDRALAWLETMQGTGYLQNLVYGTEFVAGIAILIGVGIPLALILLAPVAINIALFHFILDPRPERIFLVLLIIGAYSILTYRYRATFNSLLNFVRPTWSFPITRRFSLRLGLQIALSCIFVVAGSAKLIIPEQLSLGDDLIDGMKATGYLYTLLGIAEVIGGLGLLYRRSIPLSLIFLAPISVNIFAYHFFNTQNGIYFATLLVLAHISLLIAYFPAYRKLLTTF